ncbi:MAG: laccase domain-containing protein [Chlamydiae bacterium]|nr:laccase domain-containing protein [Chlamydiota bacterium]
MILKEKNGFKWLEFALFQEYTEILHGVFLRSNSDPDQDKIKELLGISQAKSVKQIHSDLIKDIDYLEEDNVCDAIITKKNGVSLHIRHADCQAAVFFDPIKKVIANVHCGWRGNVQNIYGKMVATLQENYGCNPTNIIVGISPSLGPLHAEFKNFKAEFPEFMWPFQIKANYFDLWQIGRFQLETAGILSKHIEIAEICTYQNDKDWHSYRRSKTLLRNQTIIAMK